MKFQLIAALAALCAICFSSASLAQSEIIVGVPGTLRPESAQVVYASTIRIVKASPSGSRISIYDAERQQRIASIEIPATTSARKLDALIRRKLAPLVKHLMRKSSVGEGQADRIHLPAFLSLVESTLTSKAASIRLLLFASPFYATDDDPVSYGDGIVPGDGFILTSSEKSVFGTADRKKALDGLHVDYCYFAEGVFKRGEREKRAVNRFLSVYLNELGSTLTSFSASADVVVERALAGAKDVSIKAEIDREDTDLVLREVVTQKRKVEKRKGETEPPKPIARVERPVEPIPAPEPIRAEEAPALPPAVTPIAPPKNLAEAAKEIPVVKAGEFSVAAVWMSDDPACDLDLWVTPRLGADEIYFKQPETTLGKLAEDIQKPNRDDSDEGSSAAWEVVVLKEVKPTEPTIWLNVFRSSGIETKGFVRLQFDGRSADLPFSFSVRGDGAKHLGDRQGSQQWLQIRVPEALATATK